MQTKTFAVVAYVTDAYVRKLLYVGSLPCIYGADGTRIRKSRERWQSVWKKILLWKWPPTWCLFVQSWIITWAQYRVIVKIGTGKLAVSSIKFSSILLIQIILNCVHVQLKKGEDMTLLIQQVFHCLSDWLFHSCYYKTFNRCMANYRQGRTLRQHILSQKNSFP